MSETKLPEKLSELLRLAVRDAQACEKDPSYTLSMNCWHEQFYDDKCHVCMSGAVMAKTLKASREGCTWPTDFNETDSRRLTSVDRMRAGFLHRADASAQVSRRFMKFVQGGWDESKERASWDTYLRAADYLESEGL
ncbi:MAG: hypothetical protein AAF715_19475 [Myxococcota bacterium]